jgi:hypothetical protein
MRVSPQPEVTHQNQARGRGSSKPPLPEAAARDARRAEDRQSNRRSEGRPGATAVHCRTLLNDLQTSLGPRFQAQVLNLPSAAEQWARPRRASKPSRLRIYAAKATK